jgi:DNA polymerase V
LDKALKHLTITGYRTVQELNGVPLIDKIEPEARQQVMVSKSFSQAVYTEDMLQTALADYAQEAVKRMREEKEACSFVSVYIMTNQMSAPPHYANGATERLSTPTAFFPDILSIAMNLLHSIYRPGYRYRKVMILLSGLVKASNQQIGLFDDTKTDEKKERLMKAFDAINTKYGRGAIRMAASQIARAGADADDFLPFEMKRAYLSPCYTTRLEDVPRVH